jgi:putative addiction module killer protein
LSKEQLPNNCDLRGRVILEETIWQKRRDGVWELRIDVGQGYRAYYSQTGTTVILLLCGGDKRTQSADIDRACEYLKDWRNKNER